jgi:hypothetical protein
MVGGGGREGCGYGEKVRDRMCMSVCFWVCVSVYHRPILNFTGRLVARVSSNTLNKNNGVTMVVQWC